MRVAHGQDSGRERLVADLNVIAGLPVFGGKWNTIRLKFWCAHVDSDLLAVQHAGVDHAGGAREPHIGLSIAVSGQKPGNAPYAISTLFDLGAVSVEHPVTCDSVCLRSVGNPHELVKSRAGCFVTERAKFVRRRRIAMLIAHIDNKNSIAGAVHFRKR